jgi:3-oxoadipate enol-lactonase
MTADEPTAHRTVAPDGTTIAWLEHGRSAPAVVMMHSLGSDGSMWRPQVEALAPRFRVILVDTRGHGRSGAPPGPYRVEQLARDVLAVADDAGIDRFHAVGLSLGGQMAMWLGVHAANRVRSLVLANTAAKIGTTESWRARIDGVTTGGMRSVRDAVLGRWFSPDFPRLHADWFAEAQQVFDTTTPAGYAACCAALDASDLHDEVAAIRAPTLVIGGELDVATPPAEAQWLHATIADCELTIIDGAGHLSNLDRPDVFNERLLQFLVP